MWLTPPLWGGYFDFRPTPTHKREFPSRNSDFSKPARCLGNSFTLASLARNVSASLNHFYPPLWVGKRLSVPSLAGVGDGWGEVSEEGIRYSCRSILGREGVLSSLRVESFVEGVFRRGRNDENSNVYGPKHSNFPTRALTTK